MPDCINAGLYSAIDAPATDGRLYLPTDGVSIYRDDSAAWVPWGPQFAFTEPVNGDFAWVNQGTATLDDTNGGVYLYSPVSAGSWDLHLRVKAVPSTPYVITAAFLMDGTTGNPLCGLTWRQSSDGKLVVLFRYMSAGTYEVTKFTDPNNVSGGYVSRNMSERGSLQFMRIADDGVDRTCSISPDGQHWTEIHSVGRTDFLTADQIGIAIGTNTNGAGFCMAATLLSWEES